MNDYSWHTVTPIIHFGILCLVKFNLILLAFTTAILHREMPVFIYE